MKVTVEIHFRSNGIKIMQGGTFPLRRRKPEQVAWDFWCEVKRKMPYGGELEKVLINGEDKTELVKEKEAPLD